MVLWIFGYGSLVWKPGFDFDDKMVGYIKGHRRVFQLACIDHRGTPDFPARSCTLEVAEGAVCVSIEHLFHFLSVRLSLRRSVGPFDCGWSIHGNRLQGVKEWGTAYCVRGGPIKEALAMEYLEKRECEYDIKTYVDFYTEEEPSKPTLTGVLVFITTPNKATNKYFLGPAPLEEMASQIAKAVGPCGTNREYLFQLERAMEDIGHADKEVIELANEVRKILEGIDDFTL